MGRAKDIVREIAEVKACNNQCSFYFEATQLRRPLWVGRVDLERQLSESEYFKSITEIGRYPKIISTNTYFSTQST